MSFEAKIRNIVVEVVHKIRPDSTAQEAAEVMVQKEVGCLVVSGDEGPIGMVTERDVLGKVTRSGVDPTRIRVRDIMSGPLITVTLDTSIGESAKKMIDNKVKRLVVMGGNGTFLGLVTMTDIIRWVAKQEELSESLINYLNFDVP